MIDPYVLRTDQDLPRRVVGQKARDSEVCRVEVVIRDPLKVLGRAQVVKDQRNLAPSGSRSCTKAHVLSAVGHVSAGRSVNSKQTSPARVSPLK
jgi:hypothetical protein